MILQFRGVIPVYRQFMIDLSRHLSIHCLICWYSAKATHRESTQSLDFFLFSAAYCNINADKWNWLPLDRRTSLFRLLKIHCSCFLVIHLMYFYLFKYQSTQTTRLHKYPLTNQWRHIWKVIWWKFLQWQANCPRLANVWTPSIVWACQLNMNQNTVSLSCQTSSRLCM